MRYIVFFAPRQTGKTTKKQLAAYLKLEGVTDGYYVVFDHQKLDINPNIPYNIHMPRKNKILNIGDTAPLFTLPSHQRVDISLEVYRDAQHIVLTFFRGTW